LLKGNDIQKEKDELMARLGISGPKGTRVDPEKDVRVQSEAAANDKIQKEREKLLENLSKLEIEYYQKGLDADTKEIADIHQKYQALLKEAGDFGAARMRINKLYNKEISDALQRQAEEDAKKNAERLRKRQDIEDEIYLATLNSKDRELVAEMQKWDALILEAEKYGIDATGLRQAQANAIAGIVAAQGKKELEETKKTEDEKAKLRKQKTQEALAMYQQFSGAVVGIITALEEQHKLADERELAANDRTLTAEQKRNEEFHRAGLIDQKEFDKRQLKAQAEHDKHEAEIKKRAAERAKKIAIQNAIINGIASVVQTLASAPYPYNLVLAALQAATVAIQVDTLRSTPAYAKGGYNLTSNDPQGYTKDSTLYTNSASEQDFIAGEKGKEWIAPNWMVTAPQTAPIIEHLESIRQSRTFAAGGSTVATKTGKMPQFTQSNSSGDMVRLTSAIERLNTILDGGIFSVWDWDYFNKTINRAEGAKNSARQ
ncbi:MAG: hypothetical protein L6Q66_07775, partial [Bacteroidia bacterium]|nr:hypothetical protein [Bacteroidia bacterium]